MEGELVGTIKLLSKEELDKLDWEYLLALEEILESQLRDVNNEIKNRMG